MNILQIYLIAINIITFALFTADKVKAMRGRWRIRESTLLTSAFIGGAAGGLLAMYLCRHKTRKPRFVYGMPVMLVVQIMVLIYIG